MSGEILYAVEDGVANIVLNRPGVGNAIDVPLAHALLDAAIACDADPAVRCVMLTGHGKLFCAGGDVSLMGEAATRLPRLLAELIVPLNAAVARLSRMSKPLVILVNGPAAGAGMSLALLGDIVLSARSAHYTPAYGAIGLTADGGLSWVLPRLVGLRRAQEIMLTNRRIGANEAESMGLVTRTVDDDRLSEEGAQLARKLAGGATGALGAVRGLLRESFETSFETQLDRELRSMAVAGAGDAREGIAALLARRPPIFTGA